MAMFIFIITQARFPWEKADITDIRFNEFCDWQKRKTTKTPREFLRFSPRIMRLFRRLMEVKPSKRYPITEVNKYFKDHWLKPRVVARNQTMYVPNRQVQSLDVPQLSIKVSYSKHSSSKQQQIKINCCFLFFFSAKSVNQLVMQICRTIICNNRSVVV